MAIQYPELVKQLSKAHFDWYDTMIPFMINQNNTWEGKAPLETLYYKQKAEQGIPEWMPSKIDP